MKRSNELILEGTTHHYNEGTTSIIRERASSCHCTFLEFTDLEPNYKHSLKSNEHLLPIRYERNNVLYEFSI